MTYKPCTALCCPGTMYLAFDYDFDSEGNYWKHTWWRCSVCAEFVRDSEEIVEDE
jgi:hypothetical protein